MTDVLVRDVPDEVLAAVDARAQRLGLSRTEYLRRRLRHEAALSPGGVHPADLTAFGETFADLRDPAVMTGAWG